MSKIGYLQPVNTGTTEELHGEIKTLQMQLKIKLVPDHFKSSDNSPDYIICALGSSGDDIQIGAAWKKTKLRTGGDNLDFLSITIDDMSLYTPLNVAAFSDDGGGWSITWRRRQEKPVTSSEAA
jgi:uncharacterized protein (DUF736 family)